MTHDLISALVRDLRPVRPIPRLRVAVVGAALGWAVPAVLWLAVAGFRPDLGPRMLFEGGYASVLLGLVLIGGGGVLAALAASVPGRERAAQVGVALGVAGLASALAVGPLLQSWSPGSAAVGPIVFCQLRTLGIGLVPALAVVFFLRRGFPARPLFVLAAAAAGTVALGALPVHMSCPMDGGVHVIVGHALAPVVGVLVALLPLRLALRCAQ